MRGLVLAMIGAVAIAAGSWVALRPAPAAPAAPIAASPPVFEKGAQGGPLPLTDEASAAIRAWPQLNPEASISKAWQLAEGPHRLPGDKRRLVTLTFDDGPSPDSTPRVLELLARYEVKATFFVVGRYLDGDGERAVEARSVLRQVALGGHLIGNHTHGHALLTSIPHTQVLDQIDRGAASVERVTGKKPVLFRPPFGELDDFGEEAARARGLDLVLWSVEVQDMERDDTKAMFRELVRQIANHEGGIVLLHDKRWTSVSMLRRLLPWLEAKRWDPEHPEREGYDVVDLPTYLRGVQASPPRARVRAPRSLEKKPGGET